MKFVYFFSYFSWSGLSSCAGTSCSLCIQPPQLNIPRESGVHLVPKRYSSVSSSDEFATIAADTMKINGALRQFKQVRYIFIQFKHGFKHYLACIYSLWADT